MKFLQRYEYTPLDISCGGYHNLLLYAPVRQVCPIHPFLSIVNLNVVASFLGWWGIWAAWRWVCLG
jgi:hypothetical protein